MIDATQIDEQKLVGKNEVAAFLGCTPRTVELRAKAGLIPYFKIGRSARYSIPLIMRRLQEVALRNG